MSASTLVDLGNTCQLALSLPAAQSQLSLSGQFCGLSGVQIGQSIDLINANQLLNLIAMGTAVLVSGPLLLQVQVADTDVSGNYGDPTSGLATFPGAFISGGILPINSGSTGGVLGAQTSGQSIQSGFNVAQAIQRTQRYARVNFLSGFFIGNLTAGFASQFKTPGSGGGFTLLPTSGVVNV